jgi:riboflavin synthase
MFTGIIRHTGTVERIEPLGSGARHHIGTIEPVMELHRGESVAVNGVCLTVFPTAAGFYADLSPETLVRTTFGSAAEGAVVNLEQPLRMGDRLGGHIVQGHVDGMGELLSIEDQGDFAFYRWSYPPEYAPLVVDKGSISVDGISLTIVSPDDSSFGVALIPETLAMTNLRRAARGMPVNLEFDVMAKFAQKLLEPYIRAYAR